MASLPLGLLKAAKGTSELAPSVIGGEKGRTWQGLKDVVGGGLQAVQIPSAFVAPEAGEVAAEGAGKAASIVGLALGAGDVLEWIAIYNVSGGTVGGGCKWGHKPCSTEDQWMSATAGIAAEKLRYGNYLELSARLDKADLARLKFNPSDLPSYLEKCGVLIQSHEQAWGTLQELLYERTVRDLTERIAEIRQGNVDVGLVTGQEARDIFAGKV